MTLIMTVIVLQCGGFSHWRRGINGALCSWAQGSLGAIVFMLARSAEKYGIVDDLAEELGLLPKAQTHRAETCIYVCERLQASLSVLKFCKSEAQRNDYHVVLASCAPRREAHHKDPDGMYHRVALELNITPYQK